MKLHASQLNQLETCFNYNIGKVYVVFSTMPYIKLQEY